MVNFSVFSTIGFTGDYAPLNVQASGGQPVLLGGGNQTGSELKFVGWGVSHFSIYNPASVNSEGNGYLAFANTSSVTQTNTTGTSLMVIDEYGELGIGTTSPEYALDVAGDINLTGALRVNGGAGSNGQVLTSTGSGLQWSTAPASNVQLTNGGLTVTSGNVNNLNVGSNTFVRITSASGAFSITGITGGTDGKMIVIYNTTSYNMTLTNQSTSSTTTNRINTTGNTVTTTADGSVTLVYDGSQSRWVVISVMN